MNDVEVCRGYVPGALGRVVELHGAYYHTLWKFGAYFESKVAQELGEFIRRYDGRRDGFWTASIDGRVEGSIAIDGVHAAHEGAHLRWFIVSDTLCGKGVGNRLMDAAIDFCRSSRYPRVYLWTFEGLHAARHLYEKSRFVLVEQHRGTQWGTEVNKQRFELRLAERT
jgi:GNAT superfamily N-acetyltransferase